MSYNPNILSQILNQVNKKDFENQVSNNKGDYKVQKIFCYDLLVAMISGQIKQHESTRCLISGMSLFYSDKYHLNISELKRSSLSDSLISRPAKVFEDYFYSLLSEMPRTSKRKFLKKGN